jgi:hypothetical protein
MTPFSNNPNLSNTITITTTSKPPQAAFNNILVIFFI